MQLAGSPGVQQQPRSAAPAQPALPGPGSSCQPSARSAAPRTRRRPPLSPEPPRAPRGERPLPPAAPPHTGVATRAGAALGPAVPRCPPGAQVAPRRPRAPVPARRPLAGWAPGEEARERAVPGGAGPPPAAPAGHPRDRTGPDGTGDAASSRPAPSPRGGGRAAAANTSLLPLRGRPPPALRAEPPLRLRPPLPAGGGAEEGPAAGRARRARCGTPRRAAVKVLHHRPCAGSVLPLGPAHPGPAAPRRGGRQRVPCRAHRVGEERDGRREGRTGTRSLRPPPEEGCSAGPCAVGLFFFFFKLTWHN